VVENTALNGVKTDFGDGGIRAGIKRADKVVSKSFQISTLSA